MPKSLRLTQQNLAGRGYFPKELPPSFTTAGFGAAAPSLTTGKSQSTAAIRFSLARTGRIRRTLTIPNPREQLRLSREVIAAWADLEQVVGLDKTALSRPVVNAQPIGRAFVHAKAFGDKPIRRVQSRRQSTHLLRTDIAGFYSSIYSHSLEWVALGRDAAKAAAATGTPLAPNYGSKLDAAVRAGNERQTVGIPIGPDTSLVLSEAVLATALAPVNLEPAFAWRFSDDIEIAATSASHAEDMLGLIDASLAPFLLALNPTKTEITELPHSYTDTGIARLRIQPLRTASPAAFRNDCLELISLSLEITTASDDDTTSYARFAFGRIAREFQSAAGSWSSKPRAECWLDLLFAHLGVVHSESALLPLVDAWLQLAPALTIRIPRDEMAESLNQIIQLRAPRGHSYEVVWCLHIAARLGLPLDATTAAIVDASFDPLTQTAGMAAHHWGVLPGFQGTFVGLAELDPKAIGDERWLLAYQAWRFGATGGANVKNQNFFGQLNTASVDFLVLPERYEHARPGASFTSETTSVQPSLPQVAEEVDPPADPDGSGEGDVGAASHVKIKDALPTVPERPADANTTEQGSAGETNFWTLADILEALGASEI